MYLSFFGHLKPKMHFKTYYPKLIEQNGPLIHFWGMTYERKNKELKDNVSATKTNKNLPLTMAIANQLQMCYLKECCDSIKSDYSLGPTEKIPDIEVRKLVSNIPGHINAEKSNYIEIIGKKYSKGSVFLIDIDGVNDPEFGHIQEIYKIKDNVYIYASYLEIINFNEHYHAFSVTKSDKNNVLIHIDRIPRIHPCVYVYIKNDYYVSTRHRL